MARLIPDAASIVETLRPHYGFATAHRVANLLTEEANMETTELSEELELRRLRHFVGRLSYLKSHMAGSELTLLDFLTNGATAEQWEPFDAAIDREEAVEQARYR